jgi:hypothetical protein
MNGRSMNGHWVLRRGMPYMRPNAV